MVICHKIKIWYKPNKTLTMYLLLLNSLLILLIGFNESNGRALNSSKLQKRIISGEDAKLFQIPYVAAVTIRKDNNWHAICTGVLVTENKVLTAAHCVEKFTASNFLIFVGVIRFYGPYSGYEQFSYVSKIDVHDGDMGSNPGLPLRDLAVLTLAVPAILTRNVQVVKLSANSAIYFDTECTITGWGTTKEGTQNFPNYLQKGETTLISTMECETYWPIMREELNAGTIICVLDKYESPSRSTTICNGDSGGPLLCGPNRDVLVGIAVAKISNCDGWQLGANLTSCSVQCSSQCFQGTCIPGSGHCYEGCVTGYQPPLCKTVCSPSYYGRNCSQRCSTKCYLSRCDFSTGFCISRHNITDARSIEDSAPEESSSDDAAAITVTLLILLLLTGSVSFVLYRQKCQSRQQEELLPVTQGAEVTENEASYYEMQPTYTSNLGDFTIINVTDISRTKAHSSDVNTPMTMQQLESYITSYNRDDLILQFKCGLHCSLWCYEVGQSYSMIDFHLTRYFVELLQSIQNSATATTYVGQSGPNKSRNRYTNICAYDHSRVPLQVTADTTESDYINASYIKGCCDKVEYISAQGPLATTVNDFIRMLWEQKVEVVVMLTKLVEHARFRCEKYWSDSGETMFGAFQVSLVSAQSYTDYTIRTFKLQKNKERRHVVQFQFTSWPDKGIPDSPWALVDFQLRVSALKTTSLPVVHCSAGVGRTGTYIALQNIVNQAMTTGHMDFFNTVVKLREDRAHMVQTAEQYVFLHQAAYVAILSQKASSIFNANNGNMPSVIPVSSAEQNLFIEQEYIEDEENTKENKRDSKVEKGLKDKPRYPRILKYAPYIRSDSTDTNNYVDATLLAGLRRQDQNILTELPKPTAVKDFWRLVVQYKVALVIAFEVDDVVTDSTIGCYQPLNTDYPFYCANYKIRSEYVCYSKFWDEHKMEVHVNYTKTGKPPLLHTLSHVKARKVWPLPESIAALLKQARSHRLQKNERILYMCRNGSNYSSLTYCVNMLLDRLEEGVALAMPLVVGAVKSIIPGAVRSLEDYKSVYQAIQIYLETSSNFATGQNKAGE